MNNVVFATGNARKIKEASDTLLPFGIELDPTKIEIDEIQHSNPAKITKAKVRAAYNVLQQPVVVSDTSWSIPALSGFPGGYMKDVAAWWQAEDWLAIMSRHDDKTIYCLEHVAYFDGKELKHFEQRYTGRFISEIRGVVSIDESIESVVILYGDKTMTEQLEQAGIASAGEKLNHWVQFGEWYSEHIS